MSRDQMRGWLQLILPIALSLATTVAVLAFTAGDRSRDLLSVSDSNKDHETRLRTIEARLERIDVNVQRLLEHSK